MRGSETDPAAQGGNAHDAQAQSREGKVGHLDRQTLIDCGKMRAEQGAGPVTLGIVIGVLRVIVSHAAAVHDLDISPKPVDLARIALKRLGLTGKSTVRARRPTTDALNRLFRRLDDNERLATPMTRIVKFAVTTTMRLDEICRVEWRELDLDRRIFLLRNRKDPRNKIGSVRRIHRPATSLELEFQGGHQDLRHRQLLTPRGEPKAQPMRRQ
ncbi:MAG: hypothetical protein AAGB05_05010 [Pseudomonadota bacterium]